MSPEKRKIFLLHAKRPIFSHRVQQATSRIARWLSGTKNPYVAFSTGKDSSCILHLVRQQRLETPAVYFDADCAYPESEIILAETSNLLRFPTDEPLLDSLVRLGLRTSLDDTMETLVYRPAKRLIQEYRFDGLCYGLRAEENEGRKKHAQAHGAIFFLKRDGIIACQPIYDWTYHDVWAYIVTQNLPFCGVYNKLWDLPIEDQRVCYWACTVKRRYGRLSWLKQHYPELFNRFVTRLPEIRDFV